MRNHVQLRLLVGCLLLVVWAMCTQTAAAQADPKSEIFRLVNDVRAQNGLPPFTYNRTLASAAQNQATWMSQTLIYSHTQTNGSTPQSRAAAAGYVGYAVENIVGGTRLTPRQGIVWWQNSAVHLRTMLSTRHNEAGVGFAVGGDGQNFYVLVVGHQSDRPPSLARAAADQPDAPMYVAPIEIAAPREDGAIVHVVGEGHTAWAIAARYEIELSELLYLNNLPKDPMLRPGDELYIRLPEGQPPPPTPTPQLTYIVEEGDTLWTIAALNKVKVADLLWLNGLSEEAMLRPGDEIVLHLAAGQAPPPTPTPKMTHVVKAGDTLLAIAGRYDLTLDQLLTYNGMTLDTLLQVGQELYIRPPATPTPAPPPATPTAAPQKPSPTAAALKVALADDNGVTRVRAVSSPPPTPSPAGSRRPQAATTNAMFTSAWDPLSAVGLIIFGAGLLVLAGAAAVILRRGRF